MSRRGGKFEPAFSLFPRHMDRSGAPRWTKERMLEIWALLEDGWTVQRLAEAMSLAQSTVRDQLRRWERRREELQDRARRPEHWVKVDAMRAEARERRKQQWDREADERARAQWAIDQERTARHAAWLATQPKRADGTVQLWKPEAIRR